MGRRGVLFEVHPIYRPGYSINTSLGSILFTHLSVYSIYMLHLSDVVYIVCTGVESILVVPAWGLLSSVGLAWVISVYISSKYLAEIYSVYICIGGFLGSLHKCILFTSLRRLFC